MEAQILDDRSLLALTETYLRTCADQHAHAFAPTTRSRLGSIASCSSSLLSLPESLTATSEKELIHFYISRLKVHLGSRSAAAPSFEECYQEYRNQSLYAMFAFVFSGGFSNLMDAYQTEVGVRRISAQIRRVDSAGALADILRRR